MSFRFSDIVRVGGPVRPKGPERKFGPFHYFKALCVINDAGRMGRARLSAELGIGEGSMRTLLNELEEASYITRNNAGIVLTAEGKRLLSSIPVVLGVADRCAFSLDSYSSVAIVRGAAGKVTNGLTQRDEAVRNGAVGATTLVIRKGCLLIPPLMEKVDDGELRKRIFSELRGRDGDAVIISSGKARQLAEKSAFAASLTLL
ncbi:MAG: hypothetical protein J9259_05080 [Thermoplasmata archaeon YP2-bin.285]|uniref:DUF4443 domain-containing protein n=1 Tax=Candidatus Sysuiplasma superficiale TaxID=2823368 RepID=A0A8J8CE66_9ARCH|nr:hypothetical protein [Candidatus Sysuiplasma superficiale]